MKLCSDCKNFVPDTIGWQTVEYQKLYAVCARTSKVIKESGIRCQNERDKLFFGCGSSAKFFEGK